MLAQSYSYSQLNPIIGFGKAQSSSDIFNISSSTVRSLSDKTSYFLEKAQTFTTSTKKPNNLEIYTTGSFFQRSSLLRDKIRITTDLLSELDTLQKSSGIFNNEERKINELMHLIGDNINQIQCGISELEQSNPDMCIRQSKAGHSAYKVIIEIM